MYCKVFRYFVNDILSEYLPVENEGEFFEFGALKEPISGAFSVP